MNRLNLSACWTMAAVIFCAAAGSLSADELDDAIGEHRMGTLVVEAVPGAEISVEQLRHAFWFGAALSSRPFSDRGGMTDADKERYREIFLQNFNAAVTENAVKWKQMEPQRGAIRESALGSQR